MTDDDQQRLNEEQPIMVAPPCAWIEPCSHWKGERLGGLMAGTVVEIFSTKSRLTHGTNPEHSREFEAGVMSQSVCTNGHDYALEIWVAEVQKKAHG